MPSPEQMRSSELTSHEFLEGNSREHQSLYAACHDALEVMQLSGEEQDAIKQQMKDSRAAWQAINANLSADQIDRLHTELELPQIKAQKQKQELQVKFAKGMEQIKQQCKQIDIDVKASESKVIELAKDRKEIEEKCREYCETRDRNAEDIKNKARAVSLENAKLVQLHAEIQRMRLRHTAEMEQETRVQLLKLTEMTRIYNSKKIDTISNEQAATLAKNKHDIETQLLRGDLTSAGAVVTRMFDDQIGVIQKDLQTSKDELTSLKNKIRDKEAEQAKLLGADTPLKRMEAMSRWLEEKLSIEREKEAATQARLDLAITTSTGLKAQIADLTQQISELQQEEVEEIACLRGKMYHEQQAELQRAEQELQSAKDTAMQGTAAAQATEVGQSQTR